LAQRVLTLAHIDRVEPSWTAEREKPALAGASGMLYLE
jgi:hypothetical protein